jgi:hypothetical protein
LKKENQYFSLANPPHRMKNVFARGNARKEITFFCYSQLAWAENGKMDRILSLVDVTFFRRLFNTFARRKKKQLSIARFSE